MADQDEKIAQFQGVTGVNLERAQFFLESSAWDIQMALASFYENDMDTGGAPNPPEPQQDEDEDPGSTPPPPMQQPAASAARGQSSNFATFASRFGGGGEDDDDDDDNDEEEGQAFFAGGSETSGQQILGPPRKKEGSDFVKQMFKKAREHGAEAVDPGAPGTSTSSSGRPVFSGAGFKLGSSDDSSEVVQGAAAKSDKKPREFVLKMWQDGFSIDDGPLRAYNDAENREFLNSVMMGRIPKELVAEARGGEVMVNMEDHKDKPFEMPKVKVKAFQGTGNVLGNITPEVTSEASSMSSSNTSLASKSEEDAQKELNVDKSQPMTTLQVRMPDGSRLVVKLNHSSTVDDLRRYISLVRPDVGSGLFSLHTTFPNKELTDGATTLKDADVLGAAVLLRSSR